MKRVLILIAITVVTLSMSGQAMASESSADLVLRPGLDEVVYEGAVRLLDSVAYVPLRETAAAFGAAAYWIEDANVMRLLTERDSIELTVGITAIRADGLLRELATPPIRIGGELFVSLQSAADLLDVDAVWSEDASSLILRRSVPFLTSIDMQELPDGRRAVVLSFSKPVSGRLTEAFLTSPDRYYIDIPGVRIGLAEDESVLEVDDPILKRVRASQNLPDPPTVRVVLDMARTFRYSASRDPKDFTKIVITPAFRIESAELVRNPDGGFIRIVSDGGPVPYQINYYSQPDRIVVDLVNAFLVPEAFEEYNDDHYFVERIRASQNQPDTVRVVVDLRRPYPFTAYVLDDAPDELLVAFGKMVYEPEIIDTPTSVYIRVRSSQPNSGSIWADSVDSDLHRLVIDFENSFFGFDADDVEIDSELISGFRAGRFQAHVVRMVFDLTRFVAYSMPAYEDNEIVVQLHKAHEVAVFGRTIVIDPGHGSLRSLDPDGGPGAVRTLHGESVMEKDLNLSVALKLRNLLKAAGANVLLTRDADVGLSHRARYAVSNASDADVFVSVHHNATPTEWSDKRGVEVFHKPGDQVSQRLAEAISDELSEATDQDSNYVGVHPGMRLAVVENTSAPAVLVEVAYMSCLDDLKRLVTDEFQASAAEGIYNGLLRFFLAHSKTGSIPGVDVLSAQDASASGSAQ